MRSFVHVLHVEGEAELQCSAGAGVAGVRAAVPASQRWPCGVRGAFNCRLL